MANDRFHRGGPARGAARGAWRFLWAAFVCLAVFSCSSKEDEALLEKTVRAYNTALIQAYLDADVRYMKPFVSEKELSRLFPTIEAIGLTGSKGICIQNEFIVEDIRQDGDQGVVDTMEKWTFWWEDRETGRITKPKVMEEFRLSYNLKKEEGGWVVDETVIR